MDSLSVKVRPIRTEAEQAAYEAALDTLFRLALRNMETEREYREGIQRGMRPVLLELPAAVKE